MLFLFLILFVYNFPLKCRSQEVTELTFFVEAKKDICFCEILEPTQTVNITYYVKKGGKGDLNINFIALGPLGEKLIENKKTRAKTINLVPQRFGEHRFCFDNSHSKIRTKTVTFQYFVMELQESDGTPKKKNATLQYAADEENYQVAHEELKQQIRKLQVRVGQIRYLQKQSKKKDDWDKYLIESKLSLVNTYSMVQMGVMLLAGLVQVLMVRSLFDEKSRIHKIWKRRTQQQNRN